MRYILLLFLFLITSEAISQDVGVKKFKNWNRYETSGNFVVLSLDKDQGKYISENIVDLHKWCLTRWGFEDYKLSEECRIFVTPTKEDLNSVFYIEDSSYSSELFTDEDLNVKVYPIWVFYEDRSFLTATINHISFSDYEKVNNIQLGLWFKRGSSYLAASLTDIRKNISNFNPGKLFSSEDVFSMTESNYLKLSEEHRLLYDKQSMFLCLLLRKEFGEAKLQGFMRLSKGNNYQLLVSGIYGFDDLKHFDKSYQRFIKDLCKDISNTPDSYLNIVSVKEE